MIRKIVTVPHAILTQKTAPVSDAATEEIRNLLQDLKDTCRAAAGLGLAAPQIGSSHRVCVISLQGEKPYALVNPEVMWSSNGTSVLEEGCLSVPGVVVPVPRPKKVRVRALDETGRPTDITAGDLLAKVLQHEIDHLNGVLITEYRRAA